MPKKELFQLLAEYHIPDIRISKEEWEQHYSNTYNVIGLNNTEDEKRFAAEDIIKIYLLRKAQDDHNKGFDEHLSW